MKILTVRLPERLVKEIDAESRDRKVSRSDVVRERLESATRPASVDSALSAIADVIGSVDGLATDLSTNKKRYLRTTRYGRKRPG